MNEQLQKMAEQAGLDLTDVLEGRSMTLYAFENFDIEHFTELVRADDRKVIDGVFDQAFKDQKDAERYMYLKRALKDMNRIQLLSGASSNDIDAHLDEIIRSYDE